MLAGLGLVLSLPPVGLWPLAFVAPWPLLAATRGRAARGRLALGTVAGLVWCEGTVFWWLFPAARAHLTPDALTAGLYAAAAGWMYGGVYLALFAWVHPWLPRPRWLTAPALWVLLEAARAQLLGGAPWGLLGHALHAALPLAQLAELTGVAGLSFLAFVPAAALAEAGTARRHGLTVFAVLVVTATLFGWYRLATVAVNEGPARIVVLGGRNDDPDPVAAYAAASAAAPAGALTIWPEGAVPGHLQDDIREQLLVAGVAREHGWLLFGTLRHEGRGSGRRYHNAAVLLGPNGRPVAAYDKGRLVPFAERSPTPFPSLLARPFAPGDPHPAPLVAGTLRLGILVCWEAIFAEPSRSYARSGVDVLVNLTSDRDLGGGAVQQLAFSRFRAIETRRWLVRASGLGPAALIDPLGRLHARDTLGVTPEQTGPTTFYARHGELVAVASALLLGIALLVREYERTVVARYERADGVRV